MEMPMVARCCFCAPLRYGLLVWAYIKLVTCIFALGIPLIWMLIWIFFGNEKFPLLLLILTTMFSIILDIVFNFVLIVGSHKKNTTLLRIYYRYAFVHAGILLTLGVLWITYTICNPGRHLAESVSVRYIVVMVVSVLVPLILHVYLFIVLKSEIVKLKARERNRFVNPLSYGFTHDENGFNANTQTDDGKLIN